MADWHAGDVRFLTLAQLGERYRRYRLPDPEAEAAMAGSLQRYGQLTPVVVCLREETHEVLDGFKRLAAAKALGLKTLSTRLLEADERVAKAAIHGLNQTGRRPQEWEEAWIVHALVREDGLTQVEVAELLGRHKSWVCRRLALVEKLADEAREDLRLGLLSTTAARALVRLPAGNQVDVLATLHRDELTAAELDGVVDLLLTVARPVAGGVHPGPTAPGLAASAAAGGLGLGPSTQPGRQSRRATPGQRVGRPGPHGDLAAKSGPRRPDSLRSSGADASLFPAGSRCSQRGDSCRRPHWRVTHS